MNKYKKFVYILISLKVLLFITIVISNYIIDPLHFFSKKNNNNNISNLLINSKYGISFRDVPLSLRDLKINMIKHANKYDCLVIGSSKIQLISSITKTYPKNLDCKKILNLFVQNGTIEDIYIFSYFLVNSNNLNDKKLFINIDPWTFNYNRSKEWTKYDSFFYSMHKIINSNYYKKRNPNFSFQDFLDISDLVDTEYFLLSLKSLKSENKIIPVKKFDFNKGYKSRVVLPDGSYLYPAHANMVEKKIPKVNDDLIIENIWFDKDAVEDFAVLIEYLKEQFDVKVILTPYHKNIWDNYQPTTQAMIKIEKIVKDLSLRLDIGIIGSYNPKKFNCRENEFYDEMHIDKKCFLKIY